MDVKMDGLIGKTTYATFFGEGCKIIATTDISFKLTKSVKHSQILTTSLTQMFELFHVPEFPKCITFLSSYGFHVYKVIVPLENFSLIWRRRTYVHKSQVSSKYTKDNLMLFTCKSLADIHRERYLFI